VEVQIRDTSGNILEPGSEGEICVHGRNVMNGYLASPEETMATFWNANKRLEDGWLRTGDLVTMDARGVLTMAGRVKEMIVSGGENIYPAEVERALAEHPGVAQAAVVGVPDPKWGEAAVAVVRPTPGPAVGGEELEAFLRRRLAAFKVPRRWVFVEEFPLTASGKVQKFVLRDQIDMGAAP
jgi:fatty-acyl-CoA synthase